MNLSLGEFEALALKAARGAGLPWGVAAEAGKACRWLAAHGFEAGEALVLELERGHWARPQLNRQIISGQGGVSALMAGPSLCDLAAYFQQEKSLMVTDLSGAVLLAPFVARLAKTTDQPVLYCAQGIALVLSQNAATPITVNPTQHATITLFEPSEPLNHAPLSHAPLPQQSRAILTAQTLAALQAFAQKTYAPATEASRLAGAGAGLSDND